MTYPTIRPELTLDFANSRQLDPRITFSRSSSATYLNPDTGLITLASEHEPRFEKDGLMMEQDAINFIEQSEAFDNVYWDKGTGFNLNGNQPDPAGGTNAFLLEEIDGSTNAKDVHTATGINFTYTQVTNITISCFVKPVNRFYVGLGLSGSAQTSVTISLTDGSVGSTTTNVLEAGGYPIANGWWRVFATYNQTYSGGKPQVFIASDDGGFTSPSGETGKGLIIYGYQCEPSIWTSIGKEAGRQMTSYIPTNGSELARSKDYAEAFVYGSSLLNPKEGTVVVGYRMNYTNVLISGGNPNWGLGIVQSGNAINSPSWGTKGNFTIVESYTSGSTFLECHTYNPGVDGIRLIGRSTGSGKALKGITEPFKVAYSYNSGGHDSFSSLVQNGITYTTPNDSRSAYVDDGQYLRIGNGFTGWISDIRYYSRRVDDTALEALGQ